MSLPKTFTRIAQLRSDFFVKRTRRHSKIMHSAPCTWQLQFNQPRIDLPKNKISTSIYTILNFIPKSLALQFSRLGNLYFLMIGLLQLIPQISSTNGVPVILFPLVFIIFMSSVKEVYEDYKRHRSDSAENNKTTLLCDQGRFVEAKWRDLRVANIIKIQENQIIPADVLLLRTSNKNGLCYVETKNLDGETNLKSKYAHKDLLPLMDTDEQSGSSNYTCQFEKPNEYLYRFTGNVQVNDHQLVMNGQNLLLRGCTLKNTDYAIGVICYTGHFTKVMLNSTNSKAKLSKLEKTMGRQILALVVLLIILCLFSATYAAVWFYLNQQNVLTYIDPNGVDSKEERIWYIFFVNIGSWLLLLCKYVPISLLVTIELVRLAQAKLITSDPNMVESAKKIVPSVQSPSLTEELGQIEYILSDKTGTLTQNIMNFKSISVAGEVYGDKKQPIDVTRFPTVENVDFWDPTFLDDLKDSSRSNHAHVRECAVLLAICHTVVVKEHSDQKYYSAVSPDELALVNFAKAVGLEFKGIDDENNISVTIHGQEVWYKLLQVFEFTSDRKRMSVVVETPEGKIMLYTKGADNTLIERMEKEDPNNGYHVMLSKHHVQIFATEGLRTLVLARKELSQEVYQQWLKIYEDAKRKIVGRDESMEEAQSELEVNLHILGVTAIEDRLQDEVGITIAKFKEAGIKVWMLTGDKLETAMNIGVACQLLDETMIQFVVKENTHQEVSDRIEAIIKEIQGADSTLNKKFALVISGDALAHIMSSEMSTKLMTIAKSCQALIACRVSPKQKQQFVTLIKKDNPRASTLAIGDGANDVYMITSASVGVGIRGLEGQQAARASDFAIGEFKLLRRLLYYHGRENYRRNSTLIIYNFYKNIILETAYFWVGFYSGFSGTVIIEKFIFELYNTLFTSAPIVLFATSDKEFPPEQLVNTPSLYTQGIRNRLSDKQTFLKWLALSIWESAVISFLVLMNYDRKSPDTKDGGFMGLYGMGMLIYINMVVAANLKVVTISHTFNLWTFFFGFGSVVACILCFFVDSYMSHSLLYGYASQMLGSSSFYINVILVAVAVHMPSAAYKDYSNLSSTSREIQSLNDLEPPSVLNKQIRRRTGEDESSFDNEVATASKIGSKMEIQIQMQMKKIVSDSASIDMMSM